MSGNKVGRIAVVGIGFKFIVVAANDETVFVVLVLEMYIECLIVEIYGRLLEYLFL